LKRGRSFFVHEMNVTMIYILCQGKIMVFCVHKMKYCVG
jgi:hypothetical protein